MKNSKLFLIILSMALILVGCSNYKKVKTKETEEFIDSLLESNSEIKEIEAYFLRPDFHLDIVYEEDYEIEEEDLEYLVEEFKKVIDIDLMQDIGDKYWGGSRPNGFNSRIYIGNKDNKNDNYSYKIRSDYNKTHIVDEDPENIDGYKTYYVGDRNGSLDLKNIKNKEVEGKNAIKFSLGENYYFTDIEVLKVEEDTDTYNYIPIPINESEEEQIIEILSKLRKVDSGNMLQSAPDEESVIIRFNKDKNENLYLIENQPYMDGKYYHSFYSGDNINVYESENDTRKEIRKLLDIEQEKLER